MYAQGDYIDGGAGNDCIILEGPGDRIVVGGDGNDRTITIPKGLIPDSSSQESIEESAARYSDLAALCAEQAKPSEPKVTNLPVTATTAAPQHVPKARLNLSIDGEIIAIFCGALIALAFLATRFGR